jgi:hypothetical protein
MNENLPILPFFPAAINSFFRSRSNAIAGQQSVENRYIIFPILAFVLLANQTNLKEKML